MIKKIIGYSIDNKLVVGMVFLLMLGWGWWALRATPLDAIPDVSDNQVIVYTEWPGRGPQLVEDQITYPLTSNLQGVPGLRDVRGQSFFGFSLVYAIFEDDIDLYWARSRVLEKLNFAQSQLPDGVTPTLGPDGTGVGHVLWYTVENDDDPATPALDLAELRSLQDWYVRWKLAAVEGVAEVASIGGFVRQYQVNLDPNELRAYGITTETVLGAIKQSNVDVGGRLIEMADAEYVVRGRGYIRSLDDIEQIVVDTDDAGTPVLVSDVGAVQLGADIRRGVLEKNGEGEVVGGVIVMRHGENAKAVIDRVKERLEAVERGLPEGVVIEIAYDRTRLIERSIETLEHALLEEIIIVSIVVLLFLFHVRSALVVVITLPTAVLMAFVAMKYLGITSNIMSLGGIAIAIGVLVDAAIVMVENAYRHLSEPAPLPATPRSPVDSGTPGPERSDGSARKGAPPGPERSDGSARKGAPPGPERSDGSGRRPPHPATPGSHPWMTTGLIDENALREAQSKGWAGGEANRIDIIKRSAMQVGPAIFFSLLIIIASFVPVFMLTGQEGRLFGPLAWTKTLAMVASAALAITLVPVLMVVLLRGKLRPEAHNPISRGLTWLYRPLLKWALRNKSITLLLNIVALAVAVPLAINIVASLVGLPVHPTLELDVIGDERPEVMLEPIGNEVLVTPDEGDLLYMPTTLPNVSITEARRILQVTDKVFAQHPQVELVLGKLGRAETSTDPAPVSMIETYIKLTPHETWPDGVTIDTIIGELDAATRTTGLTNGWTQPIINRIQMLATGIRTDVGIKFYGPDLEVLADLALQAEAIVADIEGVEDLYAERVTGGRFLDLEIDREAAARYGIHVGDINRIVETAIGGMALTSTVEGRERYPVRVRYQQDFRSSPEVIEQVLITTGDGQQRPLGDVVDVVISDGPPMIKSENGDLMAVTLFNVRGRDMGSVLAEVEAALTEHLEVPDGYTWTLSGQYENQQRLQERLRMILPVALLVIFILLYFTFKDVLEAVMVMLSVPFAMIGGVFLLYGLDHDFSVAVWVGFISLFGVAVETGVVMVIYLHEALDARLAAVAAEGRAVTRRDLYEATVEGSVQRLRPKLMTVATTLLGLTPLLWATGTGADVMQPIAIPMIGGIITSAIHVLLVTPVIFVLMKEVSLRRGTLRPSGLRH